jgi:hypothetical protein
MYSWPRFASFNAALCVFCKMPLLLTSCRQSGYAVGRGAYRGECPACKKFTYFDLEKGKKGERHAAVQS